MYKCDDCGSTFTSPTPCTETDEFGTYGYGGCPTCKSPSVYYVTQCPVCKKYHSDDNTGDACDECYKTISRKLERLIESEFTPEQAEYITEHYRF